MSQNRIEGAIKCATGADKEAIGKTVGNNRLHAEGVVEKITGMIQNKIGNAHDNIGVAFQPYRQSA